MLMKIYGTPLHFFPHLRNTEKGFRTEALLIA